MGIDLTGAGAVADLITTTINKIWPDKSEQEREQLAAAMTVVQGQIDINKVEAGSASVFVAGWRPSIGWVCSAAIACQFVIYPMAIMVAGLFGQVLPPLPDMTSELYPLLLGVLGLGGYRTFEKTKGVAS